MKSNLKDFEGGKKGVVVEDFLPGGSKAASAELE